MLNNLTDNVFPVIRKAVTPKKGTANIPPETTPKAVGGKYSDSSKIIARPIQDVGIKYGDELPPNVYLHGSKEVTGDIDNFSISSKPYGTLYLTREWRIANNYAHTGETGERIKAVEINPKADIIDLSKEQDRNRLADLLFEPSQVKSKKDLADSYRDLSFHEIGLSEQPEYGNILYDENIGAIKDTFGNLDVVSDYAIKTYNPDLPNPSRPPEVGGRSIKSFLPAAAITGGMLSSSFISPERASAELPPSLSSDPAGFGGGMLNQGQGIPLKDTITKMGVAAPVGAVLADQLMDRRALENRYEGGGLREPLVDPTTLMAGPARWGGGLMNMGVDSVMKYLMGQ